MMRQAVQDTIKRAVETGDFSSLYDCFADDVELEIAMAVVSPASSDRCKASVINCLQNLGEVHFLPEYEGPEFFANGERVVAFWDERVSLRSGVTIRSECTLVFDVRDGLITRLAIHHDLSPVRASAPERQVRPDAPTAESVVNHGQRNRVARPRAG